MPTLVRQLLLLPLLAPLLAVVLIGAVNPRPSVALRLLIWTTPALPIGVWMMLAGSAGAAVSAAGTALALGTGGERALQRQVRRPVSPPADWTPAAAGPSGRPMPATGGPTRAAGEPSPTVAVPYRVIHRPDSRADSRGPARGPVETRVDAGAEGWGTPLADGW